MKQKRLMLLILDGWGLGENNLKNPIKKAKTPTMDVLYKKYPYSQLRTSGLAVGLPKGVMGNSEVGHLNLGAGRVVDQVLSKINQACQSDEILENKQLLKVMRLARQKNRALHLVGLVSDAGVHSHINHLYKICQLAKQEKVPHIYVHAITDGRDSDPHSGVKYINNLEKFLAKNSGQLVSVIGRYYAMDRDKHWDRIKKAYNLIVKGQGEPSNNFAKTIKDYYQKGISDEFMLPLIKLNEQKKPLAVIKNDDVVLAFNFRTERLRQLTRALSQENIKSQGLKPLKLHYFTLTKYDDFKNVEVIFSEGDLKNTLGEVLAKNSLSQLRIAETEKYAHVTYFFSGGRTELFAGEKRILIPSPRVATYDLKPAMSADKISAKLISTLKKDPINFVCLNFANADMVGHTGNFKAIVQAIEAVDRNLAVIFNFAQKNDYELLITADHGNAEKNISVTGEIHTAHSLNPVPCILVSERFQKIKNGVLADIAPTILQILTLPQPKEMSGKSLL